MVFKESQRSQEVSMGENKSTMSQTELHNQLTNEFLIIDKELSNNWVLATPPIIQSIQMESILHNMGGVLC